MLSLWQHHDCYMFKASIYKSIPYVFVSSFYDLNYCELWILHVKWSFVFFCWLPPKIYDMLYKCMVLKKHSINMNYIIHISSSIKHKAHLCTMNVMYMLTFLFEYITWISNLVYTHRSSSLVETITEVESSNIICCQKYFMNNK